MLLMPQDTQSELKKSHRHLKYGTILLLFSSGCLMAANKIPPEPLTNCDVVSVDYQDNLEMTRAEKLMLMEQAFYASLHRFEDCNISSSAGSGSGAGEGEGNSGTSMSSEALQGTESEIVEAPSNQSKNAANEMEKGSTEAGPTSNTNNGTVPKDIPSAENDDVFAAQIRTAAEAETDPETRKKLWNEYRKYKGLNIEQ